MDWAVAYGDCHVPHHSPALVNLLIQSCEVLRPRVVVCLGDMLDCPAWSGHSYKQVQALNQYGSDLRMARAILAATFGDWAEERVYCEGNHEGRIWERVASDIAIASSIGLLAAKQVADDLSAHWVAERGDERQRHWESRLLPAKTVFMHGSGTSQSWLKQRMAYFAGRTIVMGHIHRPQMMALNSLHGPTTLYVCGILCQPNQAWMRVDSDWTPAWWVAAFSRRTRQQHSWLVRPQFDRETETWSVMLPNGTLLKEKEQLP